MTAIADLAAFLMLRGLSADDVKAVLSMAQDHVKESADIHRMSADCRVDTSAEKRRAYDRERQRIKRERDKAHRDSTNSSSDSLLEKKEEVVITHASKSRASKGQTVPEDMKLSVKNLEFAISKGWSRQRAFDEWDRFKDGSISKGRAYRNIDAGWRNWVTSPFQRETNGHRSDYSQRADNIIAHAKELERQAGFGESETPTFPSLGGG